MASIDVTTWGHAGVRINRNGQGLVIDPGAFTDQAVLDGANAVLITHEHGDHVVPNSLAAALAANPILEAWAPHEVATQLTAAGAPSERVHSAADGDTFTAAGFNVRALGHRHAVIHPTLPPIVNVAYLINDVALHPGDSLTPPPNGVALEVLLLPISAPWLKLAEAADYLQQLAPRVAVPIHDAILSDLGKTLTDSVLTMFAGDTQYRRITAGEPLTIA